MRRLFNPASACGLFCAKPKWGRGRAAAWDLVFTGLVPALLSGCASIDQNYLAQPAETQTFVAKKPAELRPFFKTLYEDGERNAVLNEDRLGLAALETGHFAIAERAFDDAVARIDAIYADNPQAEKARSNFHQEKVKDFKGETYERAMTYYYRGLLYLRAGEYDNARAAFLGASRQDRFSDNPDYNEDFGLMDYLAGWASMCMGDQISAHDYLRRAARVTPSLAPLAEIPGKFLAIMESGYAPVKVREGKYQELLQFTDHPANRDTAAWLLNGGTEAGVPILAGDLYYQATTQGGRVVDTINAEKAQFKNNAHIAAGVGGEIARTGAMMTFSRNKDNRNAGMEVMAAGVLISLISVAIEAATTPEADIRAWEGLPKQVYLETLDIPPSDPNALTMRVNAASTPIPFALISQNNACGFAWGHFPTAKQQIPQMQIIPEDTSDQRGPDNMAFRERLKTQF
jgi:tetratricopeptide (TPR) repeat protein